MLRITNYNFKIFFKKFVQKLVEFSILEKVPYSNRICLKQEITGYEFLITKFLITKFLITRFLIGALSNDVPKVTKFQV